MKCPRCGDEYQPGVEVCADCGVELVAAGALIPPRADALLGTYHPRVAEEIADLLERRGIAHDLVPAGEAVEVLVDGQWRDELRAELVMSWDAVVGGIPREEMLEVMASASGSQPGWHDAPQGGWVDRHGRLQVEPNADETRETDSERIVGPSLATLGGVLAVFGWYAGGSEVAIVLGLALILVGLLLPR